ncbi:hypothetical protein ACWNYQ_00315 [Candidatus Vidania fulgoroideorum]
MLKAKFKKTGSKFIYKICVLDSRKINSKKIKKIGFIDKKKKIIIFYNNYFKIYISNGINLSKGLVKILKLIKKKNDYKIQK